MTVEWSPCFVSWNTEIRNIVVCHSGPHIELQSILSVAWKNHVTNLLVALVVVLLFFSGSNFQGWYWCYIDPHHLPEIFC